MARSFDPVLRLPEEGPGPATRLMHSLLAIQDRKQQKARQEAIDAATMQEHEANQAHQANADVRAQQEHELKIKEYEDAQAQKEFERTAALEAMKSKFKIDEAVAAQPGPGPESKPEDVAKAGPAPTPQPPPDLAPAPDDLMSILAAAGQAPQQPALPDMGTEAIGGSPAMPERRAETPQRTFKFGNLDIPLLRKEEVQAKQDEEFRRKLGQEGQLAEAKRDTVPVRGKIAAMLGVPDGTEVPTSMLTSGVAGMLKGTPLQHVTRKDAYGSEQVGSFNPDTGKTTFAGGTGGSGGGETIIGEGDASTIPAADRALVVGIAEGRNKPPSLGNRPGSPGYRIMQMVNQYDPTADFSVVNARWTARQDMGKGGTQSRGGQLTRLNQLSAHINDYNTDSQAVGKLLDSDYQSINAIKLAGTKSSKRGPIASFTTSANTVIQEYIATVTSGRPTNEEEKTFVQISNPTSSVKEREAGIRKLASLAEGRADAQEEWYQSTFGKPSAASPKPLFGKGWENTPDGWKMKIGGGGEVARPKTIEEAQALPPGTPFIDPTGKQRIR